MPVSRFPALLSLLSVVCLSANGAPPPNDAFAERIAITDANFVVYGDNTDATRETGEPPLSSSPEREASVWYSWTPPSSGTARIAVRRRFGTVTETDREYAAVFPYVGTTLNALQPVPEVSSTPSASDTDSHFHVEAGATYHLRVDKANSSGVPFILSGKIVEAPANDMFAARIRLEGRYARFTGNTMAATPEPGDKGNQNLWWTWTAPADGRLIWDMYDSVDEPDSAWYTGDTLESLSVVYDGYHGNALRHIPVREGVTYHLMVDGWFRGKSVSGELFLVDVPPNDDFADRIVLSGAPVRFAGSNVGASLEEGEQRPIFYDPAPATVWWSWTAPQTGRVVLRTLDQTLNPAFAVYTGSSLPGILVEPHAYRWNAYGDRVALSFEVTAGTTYSICGGGAVNSLGDWLAEISYPERPSNDDFLDAELIEGAEVTVSRSLFGATSQRVDDGLAHAPKNRTSVWWKWTAPDDGPVVIDTEGSDFDTVLLVGAPYFPGTIPRDDEPLNRTVENKDGPFGTAESRVEFVASKGVTYYIMVDGFINFCGHAVLNLHFGQPAPVILEDLPDTPMTLGAPATISVKVQGPGPFRCRWEGPDREFFDESSTTLTIPCVQPVHRGTYRVMVYTPWGSARSNVPWIDTVEPPDRARVRLVNVSTRAHVGRGDDQLIPGFVLSGEGTARMLIRGVGPSLASRFGVRGALPDPMLTLVRGGQVVGDNDTWWSGGRRDELAEAFRRVSAFGLVDGSQDAAILADLPAGAYTALCAGRDGQTGVALVEVYLDLSDDAGPSLTNLSTRGYVGFGSEIMIPGFVVEGPGTARLLMRAVGPTLAEEPFRVAGVIPDPMLQVYRYDPATETSVLVAQNWRWHWDHNGIFIAAAAEKVGAFPLHRLSDDAALLLDLPPGIYTAHARGQWGHRGVALLEMYAVPTD